MQPGPPDRTLRPDDGRLARGRRSRARIREAARALFRERGFDGATLRAIAARAGMGASSFYRHVQSKEELLIEELADLQEEAWRRFRAEDARGAAWWGLRGLLDPATEAELSIPSNDILAGDLVGPTWRTTSAGRIVVEAKDGIRKRPGRSTDYADAVVQAFAPEEPSDHEGLLVSDEPVVISEY